MLFSTPLFLFAFLPVSCFAYWLSPHRYRNVLLLFLSLLFYAWGEGPYLLLLLGSVAVNWLLGNGLVGNSRRKLILRLGIALNLLPLLVLKYGSWLLLTCGFPTRPFHLPIAISFFTFHAISYLVDLDRSDAKPAADSVRLGLYFAFFPQLIAGPIVRYRAIQSQLVSRNPDLSTIAEGIERFVLGLSKKVLIADTLARPVDRLFGAPVAELASPVCWLALLSYSLQIYFDFSGYTDMAIGLGKFFGFTLPENFDRPYAAKSLQDFWRRWHMSLSAWFRDYVYLPLGGSRLGNARTAFNLWAVFLLCGLWHGANWTFVTWGLYHGFFLSAERLGLDTKIRRLPVCLSRTYAFLIVSLGWVLFRSPNLSRAIDWYRALFRLPNTNLEDTRYWIQSTYGHWEWLVLGLATLGLLWPSPSHFQMSPKVRWALTLALLFFCMVFVEASTHRAFIYFQF